MSNRKTFIFRRFLLTATLLLTTVVASADFEDGSINVFRYTVNSDGESVTMHSNGTKYSGYVVIPEVAYDKKNDKWYNVTAIGAGTFQNCDGLTEVDMESKTLKIKSIGNNAFAGCVSLKKILIHGNIETVGASAFKGCTSLEDVKFGFGVVNLGSPNYTSSGWGVFEGCVSLKTIEIPYTIKNMYSSTFRGCTSLENVKLNNGLETIGVYAFDGCTSLVSVEIPNTVTSIGENCFNNCSKLSEVVLGSGITYMGPELFSGCKMLNDVTISDGCSEISRHAFFGCISLKNIVIPGSVKNIYRCAFKDCTALESVALGEGVLYLGTSDYNSSGWGVFLGCSALKSIKLPSTVQRMYSNTFSGCSSLESVELNEGLLSVGPYAFNNCSSLTSIVIPNTVTSIGDGGFQGCSKLSKVVMGSKLSDMGAEMFYNCKALTDVTINEGCGPISRYAFAGCTALKTITIPGSVTDIYRCAFKDCTALESVTLGEGVLYLGTSDYNSSGWGVFVGCSALKSIKLPSTVQRMYSNTFSGCSSLGSVELNEGLLSMGPYAFNNCSSLTSIVIPNTVTSIGDGGFQGCSKLSKVVLGSKLSDMGAEMFYNCKALTDVTINEGCGPISRYAFAGCTALKTITIPGSVTDIYRCAFKDCTALETVALGEGVLYLGTSDYNSSGWGVFVGCSALKSIKLPSTLLRMYSNTFSGCSSLGSVELNEGLLSMGPYVFNNCSSLTSIVIPNTVTSIGDGGFQGCSKLSKVVLGSMLSDMGAEMFYNCKALTDVTINEGCGPISRYAFAGCTALKTITIPGSVTDIYRCAFKDCTALETVTLGEGVLYLGTSDYTSSGWGVFQNCTNLWKINIPSTVLNMYSTTFGGCTNLRRVTCSATILPVLNAGTWANSAQAKATLYVPESALADYQSSSAWQGFKNIWPIGKTGGEDIYGKCDLVDVPSNSAYFDATAFLCSRGVLSGSGVDGRVAVDDAISRAQLAKSAFWGLYMLEGVKFPSIFVSNLFPTVYQDLNTRNADNEYYYEPARALLYLDYGDGVTPFDRNRLNFNPEGDIERIHVLKVLMETFNIQPDVSGTNNPFPDDEWCKHLLENQPRKFGYLRKAVSLGIVDKASAERTEFRPYYPCKRGEAFLMLYRIMQQIEAGKITMPVPDETAYFEPLNMTLETLALGLGLQMGNFNHYTKSSFNISGVVPLTFAHTYNSYHTAIDDVFFGQRRMENVDVTYRPLGAGWSHSYDCYVTLVGTGIYQRAIVHWGSGSIHVYKKSGGKYVPESKGVYDALSIDGSVATIKTKGQTVYRFELLEGETSTLFYMTEASDRNGNKLTVKYVDGQRGMKVVTSVSDGTRQLSFQYKANTNLLESVTDPLNRQIKFGYTYNKTTGEYLLTSFTDAKNQVTKYTYGDQSKLSTSRLLARVQLPKGNYIENQYDVNRRLTQSVSGYNNVPKTKTSLSVVAQYQDGVSTTSQMQVERGENQTSTFNYEMNGYNAVTRLTGDMDLECTTAYDSEEHPHLPTAVQTNSTSVEDIRYDSRGNVLSVTIKANDGTGSLTRRMTYDDMNNLTSVTDAKGNVTRYTYDTNGNLTKVEAPEDVTTTMEVDSRGLTTKTTDPMGIEAAFEYDGYGNLIRSMVPALGLKTTMEYDAVSRLTTTYDALDRKVSYVYDNNDNVLTETDAMDYSTKYGYDKNDNMTSITNAAGRATTMTYDNTTDWLLSVSFGGNATAYEYNSDGTTKAFTKADGTRLEYSYDKLGRVVSDGINEYTYDSKMNLESVKSESGKLSFFYDGFNRPTMVDYEGKASSNTVRYAYDDNSNLTAITYPNDKEVRYQYDKMNRLTQLTDWKGNTVKYTYRKDSKLSKVTYHNGMHTDYEYDIAGRLTSKTTTLANGTVVAGYSFELDDAGNITSQETTEPYKDMPGEVGTTTTTYKYNNYNRITNAGSVAFTFDANGNTTKRGDEQYTWDKSDRLVNADGTTITYDPLGLIRSYGDTEYTVSILGDGNVLGDSKTNCCYIYGNGLESRIASDGTVSYYVTDVRGSVVAIVDASGKITHRYQYDEYGAVTQMHEADFNPFRYVGKYGVMYNTDTHYYMRARHYDPTIGRFLSEDPIWSTNLYPYADNNPIMRIDPSGEIAKRTVDLRYQLSILGMFSKYEIHLTTSGNIKYYSKSSWSGELTEVSEDKLPWWVKRKKDNVVKLLRDIDDEVESAYYGGFLHLTPYYKKYNDYKYYKVSSLSSDWEEVLTNYVDDLGH